MQQLGTAQGRDDDLGATAGEAAHVRLDLDDVLGESGTHSVARQQRLGEHRGIARRGAVDRGRRPEHELLDTAGALAGSQQLHRADDVELFGGTRTATGRRADVEVHDGVDLFDGDDLADHRGADVSSDELHAVELTSWQDRVDADDLVDAFEAGDTQGELGRETARDSRDEDDPAHGLLAQTAALHSGALEHLAVLLLRHPLATLLDD